MNYITDRFWWRTKIKISTNRNELYNKIIPWLGKNVGKFGIDWSWEFDRVEEIVIKFRPGLSKTATLFLLRWS